MSAGAYDETQPVTPGDEPVGGSTRKLVSKMFEAGRAEPLPAAISRFSIKRTLGEGGNGVVMLATDPVLGRDVAIKMLRFADDGEGSERLLREARSVAKLAHDNIVVVHEVGTVDGRVYVAMEYVAGGTLGRWQAGRPWHEVLDAYVRAGRGLAAAHAAGLVHRDFKPDNVLVSDDGRVRVSDFGLVAVSGTSAPAESTPDGEVGTLTKTGAVMGTPRYMAPEQHNAEPVDARTDQFSFCVALYEALYRTSPFPSASYAELVAAVLDGTPAAPPPDSPVPAYVRDAILRGLARRRDDRFPSMTELLAALTPVAPAVIEPPPRRRWLVPALVAGVAVAIAAVAIAVIVLATRTPATAASVPSPPTADDEAVWGTLAYYSADFRSASDHFERAFMLEPDLPKRGMGLLFNLGQAYRQLGDCARAASAFNRYLALKTTLPAATRAHLVDLAAQLDECARQQAGGAAR